MADVNKNPENIKEMFNSIAKNYDKLNNIISFGVHRKIKEDIIKQIKYYKPFSYSAFQPFTFLDLCTGTGDIAALLKQTYPESEVIGLDFSRGMLNIARLKHKEIDFREADCTNLPFEDKSIDVCVISFGLRNIENMQKTLEEVYRVLKDGGIFINLDLGKPNKFFNIFLKPYMYFCVALMGKFFNGDEKPYKYLAFSNENFPSPKELIKIYKKTGFSSAKNKNYVFGQIASQIARK